MGLSRESGENYISCPQRSACKQVNTCSYTSFFILGSKDPKSICFLVWVLSWTVLSLLLVFAPGWITQAMHILLSSRWSHCGADFHTKHSKFFFFSFFFYQSLWQTAMSFLIECYLNLQAFSSILYASFLCCIEISTRFFFPRAVIVYKYFLLNFIYREGTACTTKSVTHPSTQRCSFAVKDVWNNISKTLLNTFQLWQSENMSLIISYLFSYFLSNQWEQ